MKRGPISRRAAVDALRAMQTYKLSADDDLLLIDQAGAMTEIMMLPSAQPEIIHCRECRYYEWMGNRVPAEQTWLCHNWNTETGEDDFCSFAERREE